MFRRAAGTLLLAAGAGAATLAGVGRGDTGPPIKVMTRHPWQGDPRCRPGGGGGRGGDWLLDRAAAEPPGPPRPPAPQLGGQRAPGAGQLGPHQGPPHRHGGQGADTGAGGGPL